MLLSIIIPILNDYSDLLKSANSISRINSNIELLIVDGSKKNNLEYIKENIRVNFKYIHKKNSSVYEAMNFGIKESNGEYLYFMGAGDILKKVPKISPNDEILCCRVKFVYKRKRIRQIKDLSLIKYFNILHHQSLIYKKKLLLKYPYDEKYKSLADYNLNIILLKNFHKVRFLENFLISELKPHGLSSNYFLSITEGVSILYKNKFFRGIFIYLIITTLSTIKYKLINL